MREKTMFQLNIIIGFIVWAIAIMQSLDTWHTLEQIYLLILFGVAILVPLTLYTTRATFQFSGTFARLPQLVMYAQPFVAIGTMLAILDKDNFGWLSVLWLAQAGLISLMGGLRLLSRPFTIIEELCLNMGFIYTVTSGIWFIISRTSGEFMGFSGIIVPLTAAHFVFIGMGALVNAGLLGRQVRQSSPQYLRWYRIGAGGTILSPALVAIGITLTEFLDDVSPIEVLAVVMLASSFVWLASLYLLVIRPTVTQTLTRNLLTTANLTLFLTMSLALGYSIGRFTDWWLLTIGDMVMWHADRKSVV